MFPQFLGNGRLTAGTCAGATTGNSFAHQLPKVRPTNDVVIKNVVLQIVVKNRRISIRALAQELGISHV